MAGRKKTSSAKKLEKKKKSAAPPKAKGRQAKAPKAKAPKTKAPKAAYVKAKAPKAKAKAKPRAQTAKPKAKPRPSPHLTAGAPLAKASSTVLPEPSRRPSQRAMAIAAALPAERPLTDEERDAMSKCANTAQRFLEIQGAPDSVIQRIADFVDDVRRGERQEPKTQDLCLGLGVLWGEQIRAQVGWTWVHLTYPDGFASYALVPDDRAFACFPLNRVPDLMRPTSRTNTSVRVFESIRDGTLPARRENAYLVIG